MPSLFFGLLAAVLAFGSASSALAALPVPPDQVAYSGVLVDGGGVPLAGPVDLTARLYDAASGGTLIFKQSLDRKSTRLNSSHSRASRMPSSA